MFSLTPGKPVSIADGVWRVLALNPGMMSGPGTNSYLLEDSDGLLLIDPGPIDERHVSNVLAAAQEIGKPIQTILCSHTHRDHSPCTGLFVERIGARVLGPEKLDDPLQDETWQPDQVLEDGSEIRVGERRLRAIATPGHVSNHLCYLLVEQKLLFSGDHLINGSTVVIAPPSGSMSAYLASLRKLQPMEIEVIAPGHGDLIKRPAEAIAATIAHRLKREDRVLEALNQQQDPVSPADLVQAVYEDVPAFLHPIAEYSLHAHLIKLMEDGRALADEQGRYRVRG